MKLLNSLTNHQIVNLSLSLILVFGLLTTAFVSTNLTNLQTEAAKGGGGRGTIILDQTDPHFGDTVTFTTTGGSVIEVLCYQASIFDTVFTVVQPVGTTFLLGGTSSVWFSRGGLAQCQATLKTSSSGFGLAIANFTAAGAR